MKNNASNFVFVSDLNEIKKNATFTAIIQNTIKDKEELLSILQEKLKLPDYFGKNWDALNEVLNDFQWIDEERILIYHEGILTDLPREDFKVYLDILSDSVQKWKDSPVGNFKSAKRHQFLVAFPLSSKKEIEETVKYT